MFREKKIIIILISYLLISLVVVGCWSRRELEDLAIVAGVALDKAEKPDEIQLTVQVIKSAQMGSQAAQGGGGGKAVWNIKKTGNTVFDIIRRFTFESSRKLYFSHNQLIIYSQDLAKEGIEKYNDFFLRDPELRRNAWYLISKDQASKILEAKSELEKVPALEIAELMMVAKATSFVFPVDVQEFTERLMSKTTEPVLPIIEINKEKHPELTGTAVFKNEQMVGELTKEETRGLLWVLGKVQSGIIKVNCPDSQKKISLEITDASSKIIPEIKDNKLQVKVIIKEEANLGEQACYKDLTQSKNWQSLENRQAQLIRREILAAFAKAQKFNSDFFGFAKAFHKKYPDLWKDIEDKWDQYFPSIELIVDVKAELRATGMIRKPAKPE